LDDNNDVVFRCEKLAKRFSLIETSDVLPLIFRNRHPRAEFEALKEISLSVNRGELVGVLGRNGAGKSTLLRVVGGIFPASDGVLELNEQVSGIYELGVAGNPLLTGNEFVERWLALHQVPRHKISDYLTEIEEFAELGDFFRKPIRTYSTGMAARLFFSTATSLPRDFLLIDEMLSVGDAYFNAKCWRRVRKLTARGVSGFLATHDWNAILKLCRRCCVIEEGRVTAFGDAPTVVKGYLQFPPLRRQTTRFLDDVDNKFVAASGQEAVWEFAVEVIETKEMFLFIRVDKFRSGYGWEHYLQYEFIDVPSRPGRYRIKLLIPDFPLASGEYTVNAVLAPKNEKNEIETAAEDARSWTHGAPIKLVVSGGEPGGQIGSVHWPAEWKAEP